MSRGLGKWERLILAEVEASGFAWVGAVAESIEYSLAAKQAACRAATSLEKKGLIVTAHYSRGDRGNYKVLACPPGTDMQTLPAIAWASR